MWHQLRGHSKRSLFSIASLSCGACAVVAAVACNAPPGAGTNAGGVTSTQGSSRGSGPGPAVSLDGPNPCVATAQDPAARPSGVAGVPQYCIGDAQIFVGTAASTARVLIQEQELTVEDPKVIGDQAQFLTAATDRALDDARTLERNAIDMNAQAVAPLRSVIAKLVAAQALTGELTRYAKNGQPEPAYPVTLKEALADLDAAGATLTAIAHRYAGSGQRGKPSSPPARSTGAAQRQR